MTNTQTVTEQFYLQWHAEDHDKGAWRASDGDADRQFLDRWTLAGPDTTYTFEFGAQHASSHPYTVFAVLTDSAGPVYGVRIEPNRPSTETVLGLQVTGSELTFEAGALVSEDPKMVVNPTRPLSALSLIWSVASNGEYAWTYELDGRDPTPYVPGEVIEIGADSTGAVAITVSDSSPDAGSHTCAVYYGSGPRSPSGTTNAGLVELTESMTRGTVELSFVPSQPEFTLNLFASLATNKATVLRR